jgi:hypothetical protein
MVFVYELARSFGHGGVNSSFGIMTPLRQAGRLSNATGETPILRDGRDARSTHLSVNHGGLTVDSFLRYACNDNAEEVVAICDHLVMLGSTQAGNENPLESERVHCRINWFAWRDCYADRRRDCFTSFAKTAAVGSQRQPI